MRRAERRHAHSVLAEAIRQLADRQSALRVLQESSRRLQGWRLTTAPTVRWDRINPMQDRLGVFCAHKERIVLPLEPRSVVRVKIVPPTITRAVLAARAALRVLQERVR